MFTVSSVKQYYSLISENKKRLGRLKTNCALSPAAVERYIFLNRFFYEEVEAGIFFFSDEDTYFQSYYYILGDTPFFLEKKEKPILIMNIYKDGLEKPFLFSLRVQLQKNHFIKKETLRHAVLENVDKLIKTLEKSMKSVTRIFEKEGFIFQNAAPDQLDELKKFMMHIKEIPFYQYPYYTDSEYMEESKQGRLSCIVNKDGQIVAARHLIVAGKKAYGWIGVAEEYKVLYGFAFFLLYKQLLYLRENKIMMCSWVEMGNVPSIQYHDRIGSVWTGQMEEAWLLEAKGWEDNAD